MYLLERWNDILTCDEKVHGVKRVGTTMVLLYYMLQVSSTDHLCSRVQCLVYETEFLKL